MTQAKAPSPLPSTDLRAYAGVTAAYWAFTLTDGALRLLVLLHFDGLGFSPFDLAMLFVLYEIAGIVTNLFGGWLGARFGLRLTLLSGLAIQIGALLMLSAVEPDWALALSITYVALAQAFSGVAKDLTKMSSKSAIKRVAGEGTLFKWVALLTGSKNALKGLGFFLGGVLLEGLGFTGGLYAMAAALALVLAASLFSLKTDLGRAKSARLGKALLSKDASINRLSLARVFLFGARDVWFVVALPLFLSGVLGWDFTATGTFMALWVIGYGFVQAGAPKMLPKDPGGGVAAGAASLLGLIPVVILVLVWTGQSASVVVLGGLMVFGVLFAINSSLHSYLIVHLADHDRVAMDVGFYYAANAVGRLLGTILSGLLYQIGGLDAALAASAAMLLASAAVVSRLRASPDPCSPPQKR
ncbi:MAG: organoarsenical effux MFS transporter ArsJ [Magnetovibrionaceae bacterium]